MRKYPDLLRRILAVVFCMCLVAISIVPTYAADLNFDTYSFDLIIPLDYVAVCGANDTNWSYMPLGLRTMSSLYGGSDQIYESNPPHPNGYPGWWLHTRANYNDTNPAYFAEFVLLSDRFSTSESFDIRFKSFDFVVKTDDLANCHQFYHIYGYDNLNQKPWWYLSGTVVFPVKSESGYELVEYQFDDSVNEKVPDLCSFLLSAIDSVDPMIHAYDYIYVKELEIRVVDYVTSSFFNAGDMLEGNVTGHAAGVWKDDQGVTRMNDVTVDLWFDQFDIKSGSVTIVQPDGVDLFGWLIDPVEAFFQIEIVPNVSIGGIASILLTALVLIALLVMLKGR